MVQNDAKVRGNQKESNKTCGEVYVYAKNGTRDCFKQSSSVQVKNYPKFGSQMPKCMEKPNELV